MMISPPLCHVYPPVGPWWNPHPLSCVPSSRAMMKSPPLVMVPSSRAMMKAPPPCPSCHVYPPLGSWWVCHVYPPVGPWWKPTFCMFIVLAWCRLQCDMRIPFLTHVVEAMLAKLARPTLLLFLLPLLHLHEWEGGDLSTQNSFSSLPPIPWSSCR